MDEGYIKFKASWSKTEPLDFSVIAVLNNWRQKLYEARLIGAYENGIGFGNISQRWKDQGQFIISGSKTGLIKHTSSRHYSKVVGFNLEKNNLQCEGPVIASSESMSHAVIYQECPDVNAVVHVHHLALWQRMLNQVPTTPPEATYGSPEMARAIIELLNNSDLKDRKIFVMAGHEEGIFTFGETLEEAGNLILDIVGQLG